TGTVEPMMQDFNQALPHGGGLKHAAVKHDGLRHGLAAFLPILLAGRMSMKKRREMPRNSRVADIGKSHLMQARARPANRFGRVRYQRQETFKNGVADIGRSDVCVLGTANHLSAATHYR